MRRTSQKIIDKQEERMLALRMAISARRVRLAAAMPNHVAADKAHYEIKQLALRCTDGTIDHVVHLLTIAQEG